MEERSGASAEREASYLLAGVLRTTPVELALERDRRLTRSERRQYGEWLARRAAGEPLQYIEGRAAFRTLNVRVDRSVLIPRPETELLVERVLDWARGSEDLTALDLGTGSGAIAISLAIEGPFERVVGVDISVGALNVARDNVAEAGVEAKVELRHGSLFEPLRPDERFNVIVSNPPYVALEEARSLPEEVRDWEPGVALYSGTTGLEVLGSIVRDAPKHLEPGGLLALEVAPRIATGAREIVRQAAFEGVQVLADLTGRQRMVLAEAPSV